MCKLAVWTLTSRPASSTPTSCWVTIKALSTLAWGVFRMASLYIASFRALLEGDRAASARATDELMTGTFRDPEGWFYMARQLSYLNEPERAMTMLSRAIDLGFFCYPWIIRDPWLDPIRGLPEFNAILTKARTLHQSAVDAFAAEGGEPLLGVRESSPRS